jgi:hypothetical protein
MLGQIVRAFSRDKNFKRLAKGGRRLVEFLEFDKGSPRTLAGELVT